MHLAMMLPKRGPGESQKLRNRRLGADQGAGEDPPLPSRGHPRRVLRRTLPRSLLPTRARPQLLHRVDTVH